MAFLAGLRGSSWQGALRRLLQCWPARPPRQLRLCESLALGERRFLSLVELGEQKFLVGGSGGSLAMLATLPAPGSRAGAPEEEPPTWKFAEGALVRCVQEKRPA